MPQLVYAWEPLCHLTFGLNTCELLLPEMSNPAPPSLVLPSPGCLIKASRPAYVITKRFCCQLYYLVYFYASVKLWRLQVCADKESCLWS